MTDILTFLAVVVAIPIGMWIGFYNGMTYTKSRYDVAWKLHMREHHGVEIK